MQKSNKYKSIKDIRRQNLKTFVDGNGGQMDFLEKYAHLYDEKKPLSPSMLNQLLSGTASFGDNVAAKIEDMIGKPRYWMDHDHSDSGIFPGGVPWPFPITYEEYILLDEPLQNMIKATMISALSEGRSGGEKKTKKAV